MGPQNENNGISFPTQAVEPTSPVLWQNGLFNQSTKVGLGLSFFLLQGVVEKVQHSLTLTSMFLTCCDRFININIVVMWINKVALLN
jgi:hypothetical protein